MKCNLLLDEKIILLNKSDELLDQLFMVATAFGGLLLGASALFPWSHHGVGSAISVVNFGNLALSGEIASSVPMWVGVFMYCIPLGGGVIIVGSGIKGLAGKILQILGTILGVSSASILTFVLLFHLHGGPGFGMILGDIGAFVVLAIIAGRVIRKTLS